MDNFNFNLLKNFYYVAYYKGFTNASKNLNLAQSALSYNVKILETIMNKNLIVRYTKQFELTEDGHNLYQTLKDIFQILEQNIEMFKNNQTFEEITIGIRHYLSDFILRDTIKQFLDKYPKVHINIKLYSKLDVKKFDDEYDIVIDYIEYTNLLVSGGKEKLCDLNNIIVSGKELYKEYSDINSLRDLNSAKFIAMSPNKKNGRFQKLCFEYNILPTNIITINDSNLCKKLISDNMGLCLVNEENVKNELNNKEMIKLKIQEPIFKDEIIIAYKRNKNISIITKYVELLLKEYNNKEVNINE